MRFSFASYCIIFFVTWPVGAQEQADILNGISCAYSIPPVPYNRFNPQGVNNPTRLSSGLGASPIFQVPIIRTIINPAKGGNGKTISVGPSPGVVSPSVRDLDLPSTTIAHENLYLNFWAIPVYPASTVDCVIAALNNALTVQRKLVADHRAELTSLLSRLERTEATFTTLISDGEIERNARMDQLEKQLRMLATPTLTDVK